MNSFKFSLCLVFLSLVVAKAYAQVKIEFPIRGWRVSSSKTDTLQEVNYPASSVNVAGKKNQAEIIRGRIKSTQKSPQQSSEPMKLIINGIDMPIRPEGETFVRPYAFGHGSNSVEVRSGKERHAVQFYETNSMITPARLRVLLAWDTDHTDLDLHLVTPDGEHCFYGNRALPSGAALDVDVTTGYGPEIISVPSPKPGTYLVYVNYYGSGKEKDELTTAKISIITHSGTPYEKIEVALAPLRAPGELVLVKTFHYP
jgi:uncharacterized protein YfaP (DUF2135 family)